LKVIFKNQSLKCTWERRWESIFEEFNISVSAT